MRNGTIVDTLENGFGYTEQESKKIEQIEEVLGLKCGTFTGKQKMNNILFARAVNKYIEDITKGGKIQIEQGIFSKDLLDDILDKYGFIFIKKVSKNNTTLMLEELEGIVVGTKVIAMIDNNSCIIGDRKLSFYELLQKIRDMILDKIVL